MTFFKPWTRPPRLKVGERIRLTPGGRVVRVTRVSPTAAYYTYSEERTVSLLDRKTGLQNAVVLTSRRVDYVSPYAFVERVGNDE